MKLSEPKENIIWTVQNKQIVIKKKNNTFA